MRKYEIKEFIEVEEMGGTPRTSELMGCGQIVSKKKIVLIQKLMRIEMKRV